MKNKLDWQHQDVVNIFDEVTLWSAPFGRMLLENMPMKSNINILDIGFGTGFPLIELSQRFGENSTIYGMDIWKNGIHRTKQKLNILEIKNVVILEQSAANIPLPDNEIGLICSNLGINNFEDKESVIKEAFRVLKKGGSICITTNPIGTFRELFDLFEQILLEMALPNSLIQLRDYIAHRGTEQEIRKEFESVGFKNIKSIEDSTVMRFTDPVAVFDHSLVRIGFLDSWEKLVAPELKDNFFERAIDKIRDAINKEGEFRMSIPMLYLEFSKKLI